MCTSVKKEIEYISILILPKLEESIRSDFGAYGSNFGTCRNSKNDNVTKDEKNPEKRPDRNPEKNPGDNSLDLRTLDLKRKHPVNGLHVVIKVEVEEEKVEEINSNYSYNKVRENFKKAVSSILTKDNIALNNLQEVTCNS